MTNSCVHYWQGDPRWKNEMYSSHGNRHQTIFSSGGGPTAMAMILATCVNGHITPKDTCLLSLYGGYRTYCSGTAWGFYRYVFKEYEQHFSKFVQTRKLETVKAALNEGALAICSMSNGCNEFWSRTSNTVVVIGFDERSGHFIANDPGKRISPRRQKEEDFASCMKQAFIFWPKYKVYEGVWYENN